MAGHGPSRRQRVENMAGHGLPMRPAEAHLFMPLPCCPKATIDKMMEKRKRKEENEKKSQVVQLVRHAHARAPLRGVRRRPCRVGCPSSVAPHHPPPSPPIADYRLAQAQTPEPQAASRHCEAVADTIATALLLRICDFGQCAAKLNGVSVEPEGPTLNATAPNLLGIFPHVFPPSLSTP